MLDEKRLMEVYQKFKTSFYSRIGFIIIEFEVEGCSHKVMNDEEEATAGKCITTCNESTKVEPFTNKTEELFIPSYSQLRATFVIGIERTKHMSHKFGKTIGTKKLKWFHKT
jgi:hypothetical protein